MSKTIAISTRILLYLSITLLFVEIPTNFEVYEQPIEIPEFVGQAIDIITIWFLLIERDVIWKYFLGDKNLQDIFQQRAVRYNRRLFLLLLIIFSIGISTVLPPLTFTSVGMSLIGGPHNLLLFLLPFLDCTIDFLEICPTFFITSLIFVVSVIVLYAHIQHEIKIILQESRKLFLRRYNQSLLITFILILPFDILVNTYSGLFLLLGFVVSLIDISIIVMNRQKRIAHNLIVTFENANDKIYIAFFEIFLLPSTNFLHSFRKEFQGRAISQKFINFNPIPKETLRSASAVLLIPFTVFMFISSITGSSPFGLMTNPELSIQYPTVLYRYLFMMFFEPWIQQDIVMFVVALSNWAIILSSLCFFLPLWYVRVNLQSFKIPMEPFGGIWLPISAFAWFFSLVFINAFFGRLIVDAFGLLPLYVPLVMGGFTLPVLTILALTKQRTSKRQFGWFYVSIFCLGWIVALMSLFILTWF